MSRAVRLLFCAALCWALPVDVASATSCVPLEEVRTTAAADFQGHVVKQQPEGATLAVDSVRRGAVRVGERVELVERHPLALGSRTYSPGERYRVLASVERRPYMVDGTCSTVLLPGRVKVPKDDSGVGALGVVGIATALGSIAAVAVVVRRRKRPMPP